MPAAEDDFPAVLHHEASRTVYIAQHVHDSRPWRHDQISRVNLDIVGKGSLRVIGLQFDCDRLFDLCRSFYGDSRIGHVGEAACHGDEMEQAARAKYLVNTRNAVPLR